MLWQQWPYPLDAMALAMCGLEAMRSREAGVQLVQLAEHPGGACLCSRSSATGRQGSWHHLLAIASVSGPDCGTHNCGGRKPAFSCGPGKPLLSCFVRRVVDQHAQHLGIILIARLALSEHPKVSAQHLQRLNGDVALVGVHSGRATLMIEMGHGLHGALDGLYQAPRHPGACSLGSFSAPLP